MPILKLMLNVLLTGGIFGVCALRCAADESPLSKPAVIDVVASGVGRDETEATKDALSNAVRSAVGTVLSAETLVKNDQVIRDEILTYSDGVVEKHELIGKPDSTRSGLVTVRLLAHVKRTTLVEKVRAANISEKEVDLTPQLDEMEMRRKQREDAAKMISKEFEGAARSLVTAAAEGKDAYDEKTQKLTVPVRVTVDRNAYASFVKRLTDKLDDLHMPSYEITSSQTVMDDEKSKEPQIQSIAFPTSQFPPKPSAEKTRSRRQTESSNGEGKIFVCLSTNARGSSSRWRVYTVAAEVIDAINPLLEPVTLTIELRDREGQLVDSTHRTVGQRIDGGLAGAPVANGLYYANHSQVFVWPMICREGGLGSPFGASVGSGVVTFWVMGAKVTDTMQPAFALSPEDVRRVSKVVCSVSTAGVSNTRGTDTPSKPRTQR